MQISCSVLQDGGWSNKDGGDGGTSWSKRQSHNYHIRDHLTWRWRKNLWFFVPI